MNTILLSILNYQKPTNWVKISSQQFDSWLKAYSFQALRSGQNLGQQFCQDHNVLDFLLIHAYDNDRAISHIKTHYIA